MKITSSKLNEELISTLCDQIKDEQFKFNSSLSRRTININVFSHHDVSDYFTNKFSPLKVRKNANENLSELTNFKIYLSPSPIFIGMLENTETVYIVPNKDDPRKNVECRKLTLSKHIIFIMNKSNNIIIFEKSSNEFFVTGANVNSLVEDVRILIRDIINVGLINEGFVELHASAVENENEIYVICGASNSGKTSVLMHYLDKYKYNFVSNGRVYIKKEGMGLYILGTPESVYIRPISFKNFSKLEVILKGETLGEHIVNNPNCKPTDKIKSHYREICEVFHVSPKTKGFLHKIIYPNLSNSSINRDFSSILSENIFSYDDIKRREWAEALKIDQHSYEENVKEIYKELTCLESKYKAIREQDEIIFKKVGG